MRRILTGIPLALITLLLTAAPVAAGGGGHGQSLCAGFAESDEVVLLDSCFEGIGHVTSPGTLTVRNDGALPHTLTAVDGSFDSGVVEAGGTATLDLEEAGAFPVYCTLHGSIRGDGMAGLLVVEAASAELASTAAAGLWDGAGWAIAVAALAALAWTRRKQQRTATAGAD